VRLETNIAENATNGSVYYKVSYCISWPAGVTALYGWAEIVTANGPYPRYAANPAVEHLGPVEGSNYWSNYWVPVEPDEFPVSVILAVDYRVG
jgi:hypothetical protein